MKQLMTVFEFEFLGYLKRKSFIILTILLVAIIGVVLSWPRISGLFASSPEPGGAEGNPGAVSAERILLVDQTGREGIAEYLGSALSGGYTFALMDITRQQAEERVESGEYSDAVILTGDLSYKRVTRSIGMYDSFDSMFSEVLLSYYRVQTLSAYGVSQDEAAAFMSASVERETILTASGKDQENSFFYTYILIFALYMAIIMYGQFVASSVATEKSTRAMELLITSTKPNSLMFGKVFGAGFAGLFQLAVVFASAYLFYNLNISYYADNYLIQSIFGMPISMLLFTLLFFILGFFIYAFLLAALASLVSRMEELSTTTSPVMYLFIIAFMIAIFSMTSGTVDSMLVKVCSYIPLTSPMVMFIRITMGSVAAWEIILSVVILIASTIGIGMLAAGIYRLGVLLYGKPPKPKEIIRMLRAKN